MGCWGRRTLTAARVLQQLAQRLARVVGGLRRVETFDGTRDQIADPRRRAQLGPEQGERDLRNRPDSMGGSRGASRALTSGAGRYGDALGLGHDALDAIAEVEESGYRGYRGYSGRRRVGRHRGGWLHGRRSFEGRSELTSRT